MQMRKSQLTIIFPSFSRGDNYILRFDLKLSKATLNFRWLSLHCPDQRPLKDVEAEARIKRYQDKQVSFNYFNSWETLKHFFFRDGFVNYVHIGHCIAYDDFWKSTITVWDHNIENVFIDEKLQRFHVKKTARGFAFSLSRCRRSQASIYLSEPRD